MFKWSRKERSRGGLGALRSSEIRTLMGLWIWYQILGDKTSARALPDSPPERDQDEFALMEAVFGITVKGQKKKGWGEGDFQSLATELSSRWEGEGHATDDVLAILVESVDGQLDLNKWSDHVRLFQVMLAAVVTIIQMERWDEWMIVNVLNMAADVSEHWGYSPTPRPGS